MSSDAADVLTKRAVVAHAVGKPSPAIVDQQSKPTGIIGQEP
jgi:hypothetical protein